MKVAMEPTYLLGQTPTHQGRHTNRHFDLPTTTTTHTILEVETTSFFSPVAKVCRQPFIYESKTGFQMLLPNSSFFHFTHENVKFIFLERF